MSHSPDTQKSLKLKVAVATSGRRETLSRTLKLIEAQVRSPDEVLVCPAREQDCDAAQLASLAYPTRLVVSDKIGLCAQRNALLSNLGSCDVVVFFDDDFYPSPHFIKRVEALFVENSEIVGVTGRVVADGAVTQGVQHEEALNILARSALTTPFSPSQFKDTYALYGCNMAMRMQPIREFNLRFDEQLPLYGWLEDIDFSRQLAQHGRLVNAPGLSGVHLAEKRGRSRGLPLGYSQIANPWYMLRKGTIAPRLAAQQVSRNVAANAYRSLRPEPWVDRRGRLRGNILAATHWLLGRLDPRNVTQL